MTNRRSFLSSALQVSALALSIPACGQEPKPVRQLRKAIMGGTLGI